MTLMGMVGILFSFAQQGASLKVEGEQNERFWLYVNSALQNDIPSQTVMVPNLVPAEYTVAVTMDNPDRSTITTRVTLQPGTNYYIVSYHPQTNSLWFRSAAEDAQAAAGMIGAFGHMVHQMNEMYEADVRAMNRGDVPPQNPPQGMPPHGNPSAPVPPAAAPAPAPTPHPCAPNDFMEIKRLIENETFEDNKLTIARQATAAELMTVDQIIEIAKLFTFEDNRLEYLKFAYDYCYDRSKYYKVNSALTYSSSVDELNEYIATRPRW